MVASNSEAPELILLLEAVSAYSASSNSLITAQLYFMVREPKQQSIAKNHTYT